LDNSLPIEGGLLANGKLLKKQAAYGEYGFECYGGFLAYQYYYQPMLFATNLPLFTISLILFTCLFFYNTIFPGFRPTYLPKHC